MAQRKEYAIEASGNWMIGWRFFVYPQGKGRSCVRSNSGYADRRSTRKALKRFLKSMGHDIADWKEVTG